MFQQMLKWLKGLSGAKTPQFGTDKKVQCICGHTSQRYAVCTKNHVVCSNCYTEHKSVCVICDGEVL